jgi:hypothetical protein
MESGPKTRRAGAPLKSIRGLIFNHFFAAMTALFTLFAAITYFTISYYLERMSIAASQVVVSNVGTSIRSQIQGRLQNFDTLSALGVLNPPQDSAAAWRTVNSFLGHEMLISTIHVYHRDGKLLFSAKRSSFPEYVPEADFRKMKPSFIDLVEEVIRTGRPKLSEIYSGQRKRNYEIYVAPLFADSGREHVWGVMSAAIFPHATDLSYMLEGLSLSKDNSLLLTDLTGNVVLQNGNVFGDADASNVAFRRHWKTKLMPKVLKWAASLEGQDGSLYMVHNESNQPYIAVSRYIPHSKALIHLFIDRRPLDEQRKDLLFFVFGCYVLSLIVGVFVAKALSKRLAGPVEGIAETIAHYRRGHFSYRTVHDSKDEFQELFSSLRDLGDKIEREHFIHALWNPNGKDSET